MSHIQLVVGLGNPGTKYTRTRHNAGFWLVDALAQDVNARFTVKSKLHGAFCQMVVGDTVCRFLKPATFMNESGIAVRSALDYFQIAPENCLVVHDDMDLSPGTARLKFDGGHGGHNGLRDIMAHLGHGRFHRLRLGIGHPGSRAGVLSWVLGQPSGSEEDAMADALASAMNIMPLMLEGEYSQAMQRLHTGGR